MTRLGRHLERNRVNFELLSLRKISDNGHLIFSQFIIKITRIKGPGRANNNKSEITKKCKK